MVARAKDQPPEGVNEWLERELRETRARLHKVEAELEQSLKRVWSLESDVRRISDAGASADSAAGLVGGFREDLRQVRDQLSRIQDRQTALSNRTEEALRQRGSDGGKDKHDVGVLSRQMDALARNVGEYDNRLHLIEEALRRAEDDLAGGKLSAAQIERVVEEAMGRAQRSLETSARIEQQVHLTSSSLDSLRRVDEALADRVNLVLEQVHKHNERIDKMEDLAPFPDEARELIHRATSERELMAQRVALVEKLSSELAERTQTLGHGLAKVEQRQQVQNAQIIDLIGQVNETAEVMQGQMKRLTQLLLRQRRRQLDTLGAEIKELAQGEPQSDAGPYAPNA
jgi:chromosome segregation ATPase